MIDETNPDKLTPWHFPFWLLLILAAAMLVRIYNLDWDQGAHLHPDERYLTMVVSAITFPETLSDYWDTAQSPLNPTNYDQFAGYVYGTLPLFTTRAVGGWLDRACTLASWQPASDVATTATPNFWAQLVRQIFLNITDPCAPGLYTGYGGIHLVGRILSTLADLLALLGLALLARSLYGDRVSLLAAALYAFAVLPIQHAHFFVVDSFAAVFVVWTLYFAAQAVQRRSPWWLIPAGLTTGLAVASKISVWPLAGMVALATFLHREATPSGASRYRFAFVLFHFACATVAGTLAALAFRAGQPYAFTGPDFFDVRLNPDWLNTMKGIQELMSGLRDVPYGHQWTARTPIIFPGLNMVVWGMGLPLGVAAWVGWAVLGWQTLRHRQWQHLLVWAWGTVFFLYQGTQWVKSMRYLLPIYPVFTLFGAWVLQRGFEWAWPKPENASQWHWVRRKLLRPLLLVAPAVVLGGTVVWAGAFLQIYAQPVTRIEASRWMFENIPTAATLHTAAGESFQLPLNPSMTLDVGQPLLVRTTMDKTVDITDVTLNRVDGLGVGGERQVLMRITVDPIAEGMMAESTTSFTAPGQGRVPVKMSLSDPLEVGAGDVIYVQLELLQGNPVALATSVIANEHWDDPLPLRIDGKDPYGNWYRSLESSPSTQMNNYDDDTLTKRQQIFDWLDETDYIVLSSNRLYGSIPRLPLRYPFTTAYYDALFDGRLGFELYAEFVSFPALGPCQFPDQEVVFDLMEPRYTNRRTCSIATPAAEEAFSVYDHPTVLIFAKTATYSRSLAEEVLPTSLLDDVQWMTPLEATRGKKVSSLLMDEETQAAQQSGGTWSELFNRRALHNRFPLIAALLWWLALTWLGALAFPWLYLALPHLHCRGYGLARIAGLLLWAYSAWILASLRILPYTRLLLWGLLIVWTGLSVLIVRPRWQEFKKFFHDHWKELLCMEIVAGGLYLAWLYVRYLNPDLWHPVMGGEKPMDFAYLNAVIKSTWFPPYDPWFSGGTMNYYYFGFVMVASLIKMLGVVPSIAYNLAVPAFYAMTGVGAYTLAASLVGNVGERRKRRAGFLGAALVLVLGNLGEFRLIFKGLADLGGIHFESLIPGYPAIVSAVVGFWKVVVQGQSLPFRPEWWYWNASRVVPTDQVINEFPAFTFLYGDLHAHMLALPLTQVALAVAIQWGIKAPAPLRWTRQWLSAWASGPLLTFGLGALVAGALRATNTWDYPTYLGLMALSYWLSFLRSRPTAESERPEFPFYALAAPVFLFLAAELLFRPFTQNYAAAYTSFELWKGTHTPMGLYLIMHGQFLFPLVLLALWQGHGIWRDFLKKRDEAGAKAMAIAIVVLMGGTALLLILGFLGVQIMWLVIPLGIAAAIFVLATQTSPQMSLLWLWVGTALFLCLGVEVVVLKGDIGRMNTVFKFYLQVWMLLGICAAVAVERLLERTAFANAGADKPVRRSLNLAYDAVFGSLVIILALTAMYPIIAIPARAKDRWRSEAPHTLDGAAFIPYAVQYEHGGEITLDVEARVIRWFQDNVEGSPVIMEGQAEREYLWGNRVSIHTGLPGVAAWRWHQVQQRMTMPGYTVESRQNDIRDFYNTLSPETAMTFLEKYHVSYVVLTAYERAYMLPEGEAKFTEMVTRGWLKVAYEEAGARVYQVLAYPANE